MPYPKTRFETNDALTRKKWARDLWKVLLPEIEFYQLTGKGTDVPVQVRTDLGKGEGDTITFGIRLPLSGEGVVGRNTVEGNEEKLIFRDFSMTIQELNHAVDTGGRMEMQRIPWDLMTEGKDGLRDWWVDKLSDLLINTLAGNTSFKIAGEDFAQAIDAPDVSHYLGVNQDEDTAVATVDNAITSADVLTLDFLDRMKQKAELFDNKSGNYRLRKIRKKGKQYYIVILHNYVFDQMRRNFDVGQKGDIDREMGKMLDPQAQFEYNGMLVYKSERMPTSPTNSNAYRCVLMGQQAACWAWGGAGENRETKLSFVPYEKDAKRYVMIRAGGIFGVKKTRFQDRDTGIITGVSYGSKLS